MTPEDLTTRAKTLYSTIQALASRGLVVWLMVFLSMSAIFTDPAAPESLRWIAIAVFGLATVAYLLGQKWEDVAERRAKADIAIAQIEKGTGTP